MIEEDSAGIGHLDATGAARQRLCANLVFQVADLTAERRLRRVLTTGISRNLYERLYS
jgi:hypothetical protein